MARGRDVRNAIKDALDATGLFSEVQTVGADEFGVPASDLTAATIEPISGKQQDRWDEDDYQLTLLVEEKCTVTILVRNQDYQIRDETAEQLLDVLKDAVGGQSLGELTIPDKTYVTDWRWMKSVAPERRIACTVAYAYLVGFGDNDESP